MAVPESKPKTHRWRSRDLGVPACAVAIIIGCTQQVSWPKEPLHVVIDDAAVDGGMPVRLVSAKPVVGVDDIHRIDSGCTRAFPFRSFAKGPMSEKLPVFSLAARDGFVYSFELIRPDGGPTPRLQFYDGENPIPVPSPGTLFHGGLSVRTSGPGSIYLRISTCGF